MIFFEKKHEFGTNFIDFIEKKMKSVIFFRNKYDFFQNIHDLEKKGILKKKLEGPIKQMGFKRLT